MASVTFTAHLARYFPSLGDCAIEATDVAELVRQLDRAHPGLA
jgi:hypothetical protein